MSRSVRDPESIRERQARSQEPVMTEWEIAARRALHECGKQIGDGTYNIHRIKTILEGGEA